jgi:putative ABC transport system ATP-binding protein
MDKTKKIIEIKDLNVIYNKGKSNQVRALENVNLELNSEEWIMIFGPSGCGKSTLLNSIAGLETPTKGEVKIFDKNIYKLLSDEKSDYRSKKIGMIFQSFHLIKSLRVLDNVCLPQVFIKEKKTKVKNKALFFLKRFWILEQAEKYPNNISGGQKQKVSIARALMNDPDIILADEPTGNLDSVSKYNVMMILKELNRVDKKTIIMVTHDQNNLKFADKIIHIKDGKIFKIETVKKQKNEGAGNGEIVKENGKLISSKNVNIPMDLRLLMNSFKDLSDSKIGNLLIPFKVKQVFSHLMLPITNYQAEITQKAMKEFFLGKTKKDQFVDFLDKPIDEGGAGWDKRNAKKFVEEVSDFYKESEKVDYSEPFQSSAKLSRFFCKRYPVRMSEFALNIFRENIEKRLKNEISKDDLENVLDKSVNKGGVGLNKKTAQNISRELELIILIRYLG